MFSLSIIDVSNGCSEVIATPDAWLDGRQRAAARAACYAGTRAALFFHVYSHMTRVRPLRNFAHVAHMKTGLT